MKSLRAVAGVICILIGVFALITPFTPGSWLIFVGAELLGLELVFAKRIAARLTELKDRLLHRK